MSPLSNLTVDIPHSGALRCLISCHSEAAEEAHPEMIRKSAKVDGTGPQNPVAEDELLVLGARACHRVVGTFRSNSYRLVSLNARTLEPIEAVWQYEDHDQSVTGIDFFDTNPSTPLLVTSGKQRLVLSRSNIIGNFPALCALRNDQKLHAWGWGENGGNLPPRLACLRDIREVASSMAAFAVRRAKGNVLAWGSAGNPSSCVPEEIAKRTDIVALYGGAYAFAALLSTGNLVTWGLKETGGDLPDRIARLSDIVHVQGSEFAFAAIRKNGHVVTWGHPDYGGALPDDIGKMSGVVQLASSGFAYALRRDDGSVAVWGRIAPMPERIAGLRDIVDIQGNAGAFAVRQASGQVDGWGDFTWDTPPAPITEYRDIVHFSPTSDGFVVLRANGQVDAWGAGAAANVPDTIKALTDVVGISTNHEAAVALRSNGEAVAWGDPEAGGDSSNVAPLLQNVRAVYGGTRTFVALREDARVVAWGDAHKGGTGEQKALYRRIAYSRKVAP